MARASAGSLLTTQVCQLDATSGRDALKTLQTCGFTLHQAVPRGGEALASLIWSEKDAVLLGNESRGLPAELEGLGRPFTIPSAPEVESLNVAMSGSIIAWEWARAHPLRGDPFLRQA